MKIYFTFFLILIITSSIGQVTNVKTGLWSDETLWSNNLIPTDTTNIKLSFDLIIDVNAFCKSLNTNGHKVTVNSDVKFIVSGSNTLIDFDGNIYNFVTIGSQVWMQKNLEVSHYQNGDSIPEVEDSATWSNLTTGAWCYYWKNADTGKVYGKLYNWYAVNDARGLAPQGWHIPSDTEWNTLITYLGGEPIAGGAMKEIGTAHWLSPNKGATNSSGFSGLPGGHRSSIGTWIFSGGYGNWWSTTQSITDSAFVYNCNLYYGNSFATIAEGRKKIGFSIRFIKD